MNNFKKPILLLIVFHVALFLTFASENSAPDIYKYMSNILAQDKEGHNCILDSDIVIYASRLYFEGKHIESIRILKKLRKDHDSIYWLWKNEIAVCDKLCDKRGDISETNKYKNYIQDNESYFISNKNLGRYFPSFKRYKECEKVYPSNEFLPEMIIYYQNVKKVNELKLKK